MFVFFRKNGNIGGGFVKLFCNDVIGKVICIGYWWIIFFLVGIKFVFIIYGEYGFISFYCNFFGYF